MDQVLNNWINFFDITGAAGAQLIGLLFVVVTLGTRLSKSQSVDGIRAFVTPTLIHFGSVLLQAMVVVAPLPPHWPMGLMLILVGLGGLAYVINAIRLKSRLDFVALKGLDWIPYEGLPTLANASLIAGGVGLTVNQAFAPFAIASASGLLLIAGIYGAWDLTLWIIEDRGKTEQ
jgi:hypothetical protein